MEVAKTVCVSRDDISKYEQGIIVPSVGNAKKVAGALDVSLDYLVSNEEKQMAIDYRMLQRIMEKQIFTTLNAM